MSNGSVGATVEECKEVELVEDLMYGGGCPCCGKLVELELLGIAMGTSLRGSCFG